MRKLGLHVEKIRSKNAGPFWLTVDIFCGDADTYETVVRDLTTDAIGTAFQTDPHSIKRFDIAALNVIKFSLPRPVIQGSTQDRDMHGASYGPLLADLEF